MRLNKKELQYSYLRDRKVTPNELLINYLRDINKEGVETESLASREFSKHVQSAVADAKKLQELAKENK